MKIAMIGAACGWGAQNHATESGPQVLKETGIVEALQAENIQVNWEALSTVTSYKSKKMLDYDSRRKEIIALNAQLAEKVKQSVTHSSFPIIIGGDHAIAMGTWTGLVKALNAKEQLGLIWIDAHMDSHTPETSPSHAIHGMPLAALMGYGGEESAQLSPQHVVLIGVRSFESFEAALLKKLKVTIFYIEDVKKLGFSAVFAKAIKIATQGTQGFGISIDLDAFDPLDAPGVGTPEMDGLRAADVLPALTGMGYHPSLKGIEIVEYNPINDIQGKTAILTKNILTSLMKKGENP